MKLRAPRAPKRRGGAPARGREARKQTGTRAMTLAPNPARPRPRNRRRHRGGGAHEEEVGARNMRQMRLGTEQGEGGGRRTKPARDQT
eukprot:1565038-Pyramimonas_sp.AAC.1